jgi:hypothetical protein
LYRRDASKSRDAYISNEASNTKDTSNIRDEAAAVEKSATFSKGRQKQQQELSTRTLTLATGGQHTARIPSPLPIRVAKTGRNHLNEESTPLLPTGIRERF